MTLNDRVQATTRLSGSFGALTPPRALGLLQAQVGSESQTERLLQVIAPDVPSAAAGNDLYDMIMLLRGQTAGFSAALSAPELQAYMLEFAGAKSELVTIVGRLATADAASRISAADVRAITRHLSGIGAAQRSAIVCKLRTGVFGETTPARTRDVIALVRTASGAYPGMDCTSLHTLCTGRLGALSGVGIRLVLSGLGGPVAHTVAGRFAAATPDALHALAHAINLLDWTPAEVDAVTTAFAALNATAAQTRTAITALATPLAAAPAAGAIRLSAAQIAALAGAPNLAALNWALAGVDGNKSFAHAVLDLLNGGADLAEITALLTRAYAARDNGLSANQLTHLLVLKLQHDDWTIPRLALFIRWVNSAAADAQDWTDAITHLERFIAEHGAPFVAPAANLNDGPFMIGGIQVWLRMTPDRLQHFVVGHTYRYFDLRHANIWRDPPPGVAATDMTLSFWPANTTQANVAAEVTALFGDIRSSTNLPAGYRDWVRGQRGGAVFASRVRAGRVTGFEGGGGGRALLTQYFPTPGIAIRRYHLVAISILFNVHNAVVP